MEQTEVMVTKLKNWCLGEGINESHALLTKVPQNTEVAQIEETLQTIKCLGRVRVRGRMFDESTDQILVLCECREKLTNADIPNEVLTLDESTVWPVFIVAESSSADEDFSVKLNTLLQAEGKTAEDVHALLTGSEPVPSPTESLIRAVSDLLDKAAKPATEAGGFRRLRTFSGILPTPAGEEQFDHWLEQAYMMVEVSECSPKEKRRRIMESLKGPALEVIKAVRLSDPDVSPEECLEALDSAFGMAESGDDLYFAFRLMQQQSGEKLSDFLRRLERSLSKVVQKDGLPASSMNKARIEQLLKGAVGSDLMLIQLRLRERKGNPPTFLELLREIRAEEEYEASRAKLSPSVRAVHPKPQLDHNQSEIQSLRAEIKEVKSMFAALSSKSLQDTADKQDKCSTDRERLKEPSLDADVVALKKQVKQLQQKVKSRVSHQAETTPAVMAVHTPNRHPDMDERFCYRCGESGHIASKCRSPENQNKVILRLIQALKKAKSSNTQPHTDESVEQSATVRKSAVANLQPVGLPEGLIGPPSLEPLKINGQLCDALLDSGSRVSIIFESWYRRYLSDTPIHPVSKLDIWGLSESSYPYLGYVIVDMEFPKKVTGAPATLSVLALICPDPPGPDQTPVIIGTNAKANLPKRLAQLCEETPEIHVQTLAIHNLLPGGAERNLDLKEENEEIGCIKWEGPGDLTFPAGSTCKASCRVDVEKPLPDDILVVESSTVNPLPAGVLLQAMVIPSNAVDVNQLTLLFQNESLRDITVTAGTVVGCL
ncbi:paraneoplastic antigen Ma3 homolog, partial [Poecilia formosa]